MTNAKTVKRLEQLEQAITRAAGGKGVVCLFTHRNETAEQLKGRVNEARAAGYDLIITVEFVRPNDWTE